MSFARFDRRRLLAVALLGVFAAPATAQSPTERKVEPVALPLDKPGVWTFNFWYKEPRIVEVEVPGKGKQSVWYMWFQVSNPPLKVSEKGPDGKEVAVKEVLADPQYFIPEFELVTQDLKTAHLDEPQPWVVDAIRKIEDPQGVLNLQTTISIAKRPVPPTKLLAIPEAVSGIAVWTDMGTKAPRTNRFSVFVSGLSDGLTAFKLPTGETAIKRKTLQLDFIRPTDEKGARVNDIRVDPATGTPEKWVYRASATLKPAAAAADPEPKKDP